MKDILKEIEIFRQERNWHKTDTPANMARSIIIEAAELLENFQWSDYPNDIENVKDEVADILIYTFTLCELYNFDIPTIIKEKIEKSKDKYPVSNK